MSHADLRGDLINWFPTQPQAEDLQRIVARIPQERDRQDFRAAATDAADQVQVSVGTATAALDLGHWEVIVAVERPRAIAETGVDAVIQTRRIA